MVYLADIVNEIKGRGVFFFDLFFDKIRRIIFTALL